MITETYYDIYQIEALVEGFNRRRLPLELWTHEAHLIVGLWFVTNYPLEEAIILMRRGIILYNEHVGIVNSRETGYHETLTVFWLKVLKEFACQNKGRAIEDITGRLFESSWSSKKLPFEYYSRPLLFSIKARSIWVSPDKEKLPFY